MKILFISANTERINMPTLPFGLGCVAQATRRAGHEIHMLDLMGVADPHPLVEKSMKDSSPEVIGISVRNIDDQKMEDTKFLLDQTRSIVSDCRSLSRAPVVLGGAGYSVSPAAALDYLGADMGIQGEGEAAFVSLLECIRDGGSLGGVSGLYLKGKGLQGERGFVQNLDMLPLPEPDLWSRAYAADPDVWMPIQTRRGCSMDCSYCSTATIEGRVLRKRSTESVIRWMTRHVEAGFRKFYVTDNTFNLPPSYAGELCRHMISAGLDISWRCIVYPVRLDEKLVKLMADSGCKEVSLGFESGSNTILHVMNKKFKPEDVRRTSALFKDHGVRRMGFLLLGGPEETRESVEESLSFADSLQMDMLKISVGIRIYPNTHLAETAAAEGMISPGDDLLFPKFYIRKDLEGWIRETVEAWLAKRPNWFM